MAGGSKEGVRVVDQAEVRFPDIRVEKIGRALKDKVQDLLMRPSVRGIAIFVRSSTVRSG